jgi:predicted Rdx family selenoprotein
LILSTGEELPEIHSLIGRMIVIGVTPIDIKPELLTPCQHDGRIGLYCTAMAGFIRWLAPRYDEVGSLLRDWVESYRTLERRANIHRRTAPITANLSFGWEVFITFAEDIGAVDQSEAERLRQRVREGLDQAAAAQAQFQADSNPTERFIELLNAAIRGGAAHVATLDGTAPLLAGSWGWVGQPQRDEDGEVFYQPQGQRVGWLDGDDLYLNPDVAYQVAQRTALGGVGIAVSAQTLWKRLREGGYLASIDEARETNKVRRMIAGRSTNVIHIKSNALDLS